MAKKTKRSQGADAKGKDRLDDASEIALEGTSKDSDAEGLGGSGGMCVEVIEDVEDTDGADGEIFEEVEDAEDITGEDGDSLQDRGWKTLDVRVAYQMHREAIQSVAKADVILPVSSIRQAAQAGLRASQSAQEDQERLQRLIESGEVDGERVRNLRTLTLALMFADMVWRQARYIPTQPEKDKLRQEVHDAWKRLMEAADYVWRHHERTQNLLRDLRKKSTGRKMWMSFDLLVRFFEGKWEEVEGRCQITRDDIVRARALAEQAVSSLLIDQKPAAPTLLLRNQAYTLFFQAHEETCEAGRFLYRKTPAVAMKRYPKPYPTRRTKKKGT